MENKSWNNTVVGDRLLLNVSIKVEDSGLYLFLFSFLFSFSLLFYFLIWNLELVSKFKMVNSKYFIFLFSFLFSFILFSILET